MRAKRKRQADGCEDSKVIDRVFDRVFDPEFDVVMVDLRTVSISGAFNCARARVLWHDGMLKVFDINGLVLKIEADKPVRRKGYVMSWEANTKKGRINMRGKCMTCGGKRWWRVVYMGDEQLWMSA